MYIVIKINCLRDNVYTIKLDKNCMAVCCFYPADEWKILEAFEKLDPGRPGSRHKSGTVSLRAKGIDVRSGRK
jgi:hypothetical protein